MNELQQYFALGFKCFPCSVIMVKNKDGSRKKVPVFGPRDTEFARWGHCQHTPETFKARKQALKQDGKEVNGICIKTGKDSGVSVLDVDNKPGALELVCQLAPGIAQGPCASTPSGGMHFYFRYNPQVRSIANPAQGIDARGDGGLVIAPPSFNPKGIYKWVNPIKTLEELPEFPPVLVGHLFGLSNFIPHKKSEKVCPKMTLDQVNSMLAVMAGTRYDYDDWIRICSAIWTEFSFEETEKMLKRWMPEEKSGEYEAKFAGRIQGQITMGTFFHYYREAMDRSITGRKSVPVAPSRPVFSPPTVTPPKIIVVPEAPTAVLEPVIAKPVVLPKNDGLEGAREYLRFLLQFHRVPAYRIV